MKKIVLILCAAALALVSCNKQPMDVASAEAIDTPTDVVFNLSATHPDGAATKAVKSGWEADDLVYVFFSEQAVPAYLALTYNGSTWESAAKNGLALTEGESGTMTAVFLPFGHGAAVVDDGSGLFTFAAQTFSYYLTAQLPYTVTDNQVDGTFEMKIPDGFLQFWVEDAEAVDGGYALATRAVQPVGIQGLSPGGSIIETVGNAGDDLPGYAYAGGYLFSGKISESYPHDYVENLYFTKTCAADQSKADYTVTGKALASHAAYRLPANGDAAWQPGLLPGIFSIGERQLRLSQGNLQAVIAAGKISRWQFANEQWEMALNSYDSEVNDGTVDGFRVSTTAPNNRWGTFPGTLPDLPLNPGLGTDPDPAVVQLLNDCMVGTITHQWQNPDFVAEFGNGWTSLSPEELFALMYEYVETTYAPHHGEVKWYLPRITTANVAGIDGVILPADDFRLPSGMTLVKMEDKVTDSYVGAFPLPNPLNIFSAEEWTRMERAGAAFFPYALYKHPTNGEITLDAVLNGPFGYACGGGTNTYLGIVEQSYGFTASPNTSGKIRLVKDLD